MESASVTMMTGRKTAIGTMWVLLSLPVAVALVGAVQLVYRPTAGADDFVSWNR